MSKNYVKEYKGHEVPEGATHCRIAKNGVMDFYKHLSELSEMRFFNNGRWWATDTYLDGSEPPEDLPEEQSQQWVDGFPPIGCECEVLNDRMHNAEYEKCVILWIGKYSVVYTSDSCNERTGTIDLCKFRQLKTQEQKDREAFIERAAKVINNSVDDSPAGWASAMFYAGFKAPEDE